MATCNRVNYRVCTLLVANQIKGMRDDNGYCDDDDDVDDVVLSMSCCAIICLFSSSSLDSLVIMRTADLYFPLVQCKPLGEMMGLPGC